MKGFKVFRVVATCTVMVPETETFMHDWSVPIRLLIAERLPSGFGVSPVELDVEHVPVAPNYQP